MTQRRTRSPSPDREIACGPGGRRVPACRCMRSAIALVALLALAPLLALRCTRTCEAQARAEKTTPAPLTVDVPGDKAVLVVPGDARIQRPIIHLHGMCAQPRKNLEAWGGVAKDQGTIVALVGDLPCPGREGTKWSDDAAKIDARIAAAIASVNAARGTTLDPSEVLVVGESMGAARAESLAKENPERYLRLVLVGSPQIVAPANVHRARAIANLAGALEPQQRAKTATLAR